MKKEFKVGDKVILELVIDEVKDCGFYAKSTTDKPYFIFYADNVKHAEHEFIPREIICWDDNEHCVSTEKVIGMFNGRFVADNGGGDWYIYKNSKEVPKELENGKVYKHKNGWIAYKICDKLGFGFEDGVFFNETINFTHAEDYQEYPLESFKKLLIVEAEKRGFEEGVWVDRKVVDINEIRITELKGSDIYFNDELIGFCDFKFIFKNGIWAKIIN